MKLSKATSLLSFFWIAQAAACAGQPYAFRHDPAYSRLPRVNLTLTTHSQGMTLQRLGDDLRYGVERQLAKECVAAAAEQYDESFPTVQLEIIDRGATPSRELDRVAPSSVVIEAQKSGFGDLVGPSDHGSAVAGRGDARIVEVVVRTWQGPDSAPATLGHIRVLAVEDFVVAEKTAEMVAAIVQRHLQPSRD